ncbi:MAG: GNAT family N-acetyltransferase [Alphaproteobacteria bacterium]
MSTLPTPWNDPIFTAAMAQALLNQPHHILLTHNSSHLLARVVPHSPADVLTLYTPPEARRHGHARALMNQLIAHARVAPCPAITLEVRASNTPARALYESLGFSIQTTRKGYYANPVDDAVVYGLALENT